MNQDPIVILSYARTPMGSFQGALAGASATELGATAVRAAVERAGVSGEAIDKIFMGCVLPAGLGPSGGARRRLAEVDRGDHRQ
jgi:acetyl-CoA C-acetyltransferase